MQSQTSMADKRTYDSYEDAAEAAVVQCAAKEAAGYPDDNWIIVEADDLARAILKAVGIPEPPGRRLPDRG